MLDFKNLIP